MRVGSGNLPSKWLGTRSIGQKDPEGSADRILWEAPQKAQQVWFINLLGANVNLNIAPNDVIPLETLRLGIRGDTFFNYLPDGQDLKPTVKS